MALSEAKVIANYESDFYKGTPAITKNKYNKGTSYYLGARTKSDFLEVFYDDIVKDLDLDEIKDFEASEGVSIQSRENDENKYYFIMNFTEEDKEISINNNYENLITSEMISGKKVLKPYETLVLKK